MSLDNFNYKQNSNESMSYSSLNTENQATFCPSLSYFMQVCVYIYIYIYIYIYMKRSCSIVSDSLPPHGLQPTRLLCPWDFPGKSTGVGCHFLLQGIFPTQGLNPGLLYCRQTLYCLSHQESPLKMLKRTESEGILMFLEQE